MRSGKIIYPVIMAAVFVFTVVWFGFFASLSIDPHHDGVMIKCAADVASGRVLFRETFCQYGDLCIRLQALAVKIFGPEVLVIRLLTVLFYGGIAVLLDIIWRRFLPVSGRILQMVFFWGLAPFYIVPFHPWTSVYALFFLLISLEALLRYFECFDRTGDNGIRRVCYLAASAASAGCAFGMRTPVGVVTLAALLLSLAVFELNHSFSSAGIARLLRSSALAVAAFLLVPVLSLIKIIADGAMSEYLHQCFGYVGRFAAERGGVTGERVWERVSQALFPLVSSNWILDAFFGILPLVILFYLLVMAAKLRERKWDSREVAVISAMIFGLASWHQYYPVPCVRHLYWASIPMYGAYILIAGKLWNISIMRGKAGKAYRHPGGAIAAVLLMLIVLPAILLRMDGAVERLKNINKRQTLAYSPMRGLRLLRHEAAYIDSFAAVFSRLPVSLQQRGVFNYTEDSLFPMLLPEAKGWKHPMFVSWGPTVYPDFPEVAAEFVRQYRPVVLSNRKDLPFPGYYTVCEMQLWGKSTFVHLPAE